MDKEDVYVCVCVCVYVYIYTHTHTHTHTKWNTPRPQKDTQFCHLQQHGWTWRPLCQMKLVIERQILYDISYIWNLKNATQ